MNNKCEKCGCEDFFTYRDKETRERITECQNCGSKLESNIMVIEEE